MDDLLDALTNRLEDFGLRVDVWDHPASDDVGYDVEITLSRGASRRRFAMQLKRHATLSDFGNEAWGKKTDLPMLVGAASVSPRSADAFRRAGVQYVDASGNACIHFGDVLVDVRGRRSERDASESARGRGGNLFSAARAQVAFALLQWPRSWKKPQRELAEAAGVSLGQVNDALKMFREIGFGPGGHRSDSELLDLWVASFPSGLGQKILLAKYRGSIDDFRKVDAEDPVFVGGAALSGELAVDDLLRPSALTIYVTKLDPMLPVKNRWRSDGDANITVRRKFWTTPPDETHDYDGPLVGLRNAPAVLVYADLMASDNPRVRSVAPEWRSRIARHEQGR
jgi:hypothetical protein